MYSGGNLKLYITLRKFYFPYYPNFNALAIQCVTAVPHYHCITLSYESVLHYHFTLIKYVQLLTLSIAGLFIAILTTLIAPCSHEKRLNDTLYHNHIKASIWALKRVINLSSETTLLFLYLFIHSYLFIECSLAMSINAYSSRFLCIYYTLYLKAF